MSDSKQIQFALLAGISFIYELQNCKIKLSYTDMLVLLHMLLFKCSSAARLAQVIPRDRTRISASLNLLEQWKIVEQKADRKNKCKTWSLTPEGEALAETLWRQFCTRFESMKEIL